MMKKTALSLFLCLSLVTALLLPTAALAGENDTGYGFYEDFNYADSSEMFGAGWTNTSGTGSTIVSNAEGASGSCLYIPKGAGTTNQLKRDFAASGTRYFESYTLEIKLKLEYTAAANTGLGLILYDGSKRNDFRVYGNGLLHRNSDGSSPVWNTAADSAHVSGTWYTYKIESDGTGTTVYRKTEGGEYGDALFTAKTLNANTGNARIDLFTSAKTTGEDIYIDYIKVYNRYTGVSGSPAAGTKGVAYFADDFSGKENLTYDYESDGTTTDGWRMIFGTEAGNTVSTISTSSDGYVTLNANGTTDVVRLTKYCKEIYDDVAMEMRFKLSGAKNLTNDAGLGIQLYGEALTDRVFLVLNPNRTYLNSGGWKNTGYKFDPDTWYDLRIEKVNSIANIYVKKATDSEYFMLFGNMATLSSTSENSCFVTMFLQKDATFSVSIDSIALSDLNAAHISNMTVSESTADGVLTEGETVTAAFEAKDVSELNYTSENVTGTTVIFALYDANDMLIDVDAKTLSVGVNAVNSYSISFTVPQGAGEGAYVKAFAWGALHDLIPWADSIRYPEL